MTDKKKSYYHVKKSRRLNDEGDKVFIRENDSARVSGTFVTSNSILASSNLSATSSASSRRSSISEWQVDCLVRPSISLNYIIARTG